MRASMITALSAWMDDLRLEVKVGEPPEQAGHQLSDSDFAIADRTHWNHVVTRLMKGGDHRVEITRVLRGDMPTH